MRPQRRDSGQAAVEFAIALPLVVVMVLAIVQVAAVVSDQLALELAARDGARAAAVAAEPQASARRAADAATNLRPIDVATSITNGRVSVTVSYTDQTTVALIGAVVGDVSLSATVTMAREPP